MHYLKRIPGKNGEEAISPVVGVMLMLVVTIIIAAVVSAFAGGSMTGSQKAPSANVEIHVKNGGDSTNSYFTMKVLGVSEPIPTKNLRIITSWTTSDRSTGAATSGGNTTFAGMAGVVVPNEQTDISGTTGTNGNITVPTGYGNGVMKWANDTVHPSEAMWGNFVLSSGTSLFDRPDGYSNYQYRSLAIDPMTSILGKGWNDLKPGDAVTVRIIDAKSGKTIVDQNVFVEG